jgi:hypothetical protein
MTKKTAAYGIILTTVIIYGAGCRRPLLVQPTVKSETLIRTGYVIQVGAFADINNAINLTKLLEQAGLDAYYFRHESGLYKVRFGDFSSRERALVHAMDLLRDKLIPDYYIVRPEEYPAAKADVSGPGYLRKKIVQTAENFTGIKYSWGGSSPETGFDCSGLTMAVYKLNGFNLPRNSRRQFETGLAVSLSNLKKGDLVFFATGHSPSRVSHVGIYVGNGHFIHAPGKNTRIRKDRLDLPYYRSRFVGGRCYLIQ